jgi:hypothetical protein
VREGVAYDPVAIGCAATEGDAICIESLLLLASPSLVESTVIPRQSADGFIVAMVSLGERLGTRPLGDRRLPLLRWSRLLALR